MDMQTVSQIVINPYLSIEDRVKFWFSKPDYLMEWLGEKGKALAGISIDCAACVVSNFLAEKLTAAGYEILRVEVAPPVTEIFEGDNHYEIKLPRWVQNFVEDIDSHRNGRNIWDTKNRKSRIFSGNLARNILRVSLKSAQE